MFGINDPGIWMAYLIAVGCVIFAAWYGIAHWNEEDKPGNNPKSSEQ
jgi:hypothetical protein